MKNESLSLLKTKRDYIFFALFIVAMFTINIFYEYSKFKDITEEEVYSSEAVVLNIYYKKNKNILKLKENGFIFYTKADNIIKLKKQDRVKVLFISKYITFYDYLKGSFVKIIDISKLHKPSTLKNHIAFNIKNNHQNTLLTELFQALFLAYPISQKLRDICTTYGISHLIAISGFHLGVLSFCIYWFINMLYSPLHQKYLNYRNKKFDILICTLFFLFLYLILTDIVPSLLRAFIMFLMGIFFLRSNIKILSFSTLFLTLLLILTLFPKYIFSLGLWFSIAGVFYIYLFLKYFQNFSKLFILLFFNFWIFFALNPVIHYFFEQTSYLQLLSPFITLAFTAFYPIELFLHIIGFGDLLDKALLWFLNIEVDVYVFTTSLKFLIFYIFVSFAAILKKEFFIVLNLLIAGFNLVLYV